MKRRPPTYVSLFAGAGGFDLGFDRAGFRCLAQVELDPTARAVLERHWPDVPKFEDVREFGAKQVNRADVVVGGFPCQDLSVAGKREGLTGERSGLFYELVRIAVELRARYLVWENVPGLFSSFTPTSLPPEPVEGREWEVDESSDFETVLSHLAECGFSGAWRVLDARHFGVPQSRRRIFGCFTRRRALAGRCAEILALSEGVRRDPQARREAGAGTATATALRSRNGGPDDNAAQGRQRGVAPGAVASCLQGAGADGRGHRIDAESAAGNQLVVAPAITAGAHPGGFNGQDIKHLVFGGNDTSGERDVAAALTARSTLRQDFETESLVVAYQCHGSDVGAAGTLRSGNGGVTGGVPFVFAADDYREGTYAGVDTAPPLTTGTDRTRGTPLVACLSGDGDPKGREDGCAYALKARAGRGHGDGKAVAVRTCQTSANGLGVQDDAAYSLDSATPQAVCVTGTVTHTLTADGADASEDGTGRGTPIVAEAVAVAQNQRGELRTSDTATAVTCGGGKPGEGYPAAMVAGLVRRLTPLECERLMGWPDEHTRYRADGSEIADGPRYRLCGNGVVATVSEWLARRIFHALRAKQ